MVKSHVSCEPGFHWGSCTWELGTKGILEPGTRALPGTTGGAMDCAIAGKIIVLPFFPTRNAVVGSVPPLCLQSPLGEVVMPAFTPGPRHSRLCEKPTA